MKNSLLVVVMLVACSSLAMASGTQKKSSSAQSCPVSGKTINTKYSVSLMGGQKIYFCSDKSKNAFLKDPKKFLKSDKKGSGKQGSGKH